MVLRCLFASLIVAAAASPQSASGTAHGFDGAPCPFVVVRARAGDRIVYEGLTDASGRFVIVAAEQLTDVALELEGVRVQLAVPGGEARDLVAHFDQQRFDIVRGKVLDPAGDPAREVDLVCSGKDGTIAAITTDAAGAFVLRTQTPIEAFTIDPCGWACRVAGPFPVKDSALQLRCEPGFVRLQGHCFDDADHPAAGWQVRARRAGTRIASSRIAADGSFTLWVRSGADEVEATDGVVRIGQSGQWTDHARLLLRARDHGIVLLRGRVVDADGAPIVGADVFPSLAATPPPRTVLPIARTDRSGRFVAPIFNGQPFLFVAHVSSRRTGSAAVPQDEQPVEITIR